MTRSPFINAGAALAYIALVATVMFNVPKVEDKVEGLIGPIAFLSLFTLSAAVMAYLFLLEPVKLIIEGKQGEGTKLFLSTLLIFAGITTLIFFSIFFLGVRP